MENHSRARARGRASSYSRKLGEIICHRIANGETLRTICESDLMPSYSTARNWLDKNKSYQHGFYLMYQDALRKKDDAAKNRTIDGRKTYVRYSPDIASKICDRIAAGKNLLDITDEPGMPTYETVRAWLLPSSKIYQPEFYQHYKIAQSIKADLFFDKIEKLADDPGYEKEEIARAKFQIEAYQIAAARNNPEKFLYKKGIEISSDPEPQKLEPGKTSSPDHIREKMRELVKNPDTADAMRVVANSLIELEKNEP